MNNKIDACKKTRAIASGTLATTLQGLLSPSERISEKMVANNWLLELRKNQNVFPDGWYTPPPHGISVLFGTADQNGRQNYTSLRPEALWSKDNIYFNEMGYLFASPVDKKTGIIGDFGLTIYRGERQEIKDHLKKCLSINREIFEYIEVGMKFSDIFDFAEKKIISYGMINTITSTTDPTGRDYGHTVPATYFDWTSDERATLEKGDSDWESVKNMVNRKRVFVNPIETMTYQPGMAVTLEPRMISVDNPNLPMSSFHTIVVIHDDGKKELLTNFDKIFKLIGMDYMM